MSLPLHIAHCNLVLEYLWSLLQLEDCCDLKTAQHESCVKALRWILNSEAVWKLCVEDSMVKLCIEDWILCWVEELLRGGAACWCVCYVLLSREELPEWSPLGVLTKELISLGAATSLFQDNILWYYCNFFHKKIWIVHVKPHSKVNYMEMLWKHSNPAFLWELCLSLTNNESVEDYAWNGCETFAMAERTRWRLMLSYIYVEKLQLDCEVTLKAALRLRIPCERGVIKYSRH